MALDLTAKNDLLRQASQPSIQHHVAGAAGRRCILFRHFPTAAQTHKLGASGSETRVKGRWRVWSGGSGAIRARLQERHCSEGLQTIGNGKTENLSGPPRFGPPGACRRNQQLLFPSRAALRFASLSVGTCAENSLIAAYRTLPPLTALRGGRKSGRRAGNGRVQAGCSLPPVCAPSCCSRRRSPASGQYHCRTPPSCPPHNRRTLFHETDGGAALLLPVCIEWFYFLQQISASFPSFTVAIRRRRQAALECRPRNRSSSILRGPAPLTTTNPNVIGKTVFRLA
jgi:hypothetical protein